MNPSKGDMIDLVNGLCLIEDKIKAECGFDFMKDPKLSNVEALKVPMFYVWSRLYGHTHTLSDVLCVEQTLWSYPHSITSWNKCLLAGEL